jgi:hypothetical protein
MAQSLTNVELPCVKNENGKVTALEHDDVACIIFKALKEAGNADRFLALNLADKVIYRLKCWKGIDAPLTIYDVEYMTKYVLIEAGHNNAAKLIGTKPPQLTNLNWG